MTDADLIVFWKLHEGLLCQSPGSFASTARAFHLVPNRARLEHVADLGSGPGRQTFDLARLTTAEIRACDLLPSFVDDLNRRAADLGLSDRVRAEQTSMLDAVPGPKGYDLIWCEGAVYNVGFETALRTWRPWLAPDGVVAVSEATWLTNDPPDLAREFWAREYPPMQSHAANLACIAACGYDVLGTFPIPPADWKAYYDPIDIRVEQMRRGERDPEMLAALDAAMHESRVYRESNGSYGYVFYVIRPTR